MRGLLGLACIVSAFGDVALVVNNAGVGQQRGSVVDTAETEMQRVMAVNFQGCMRGCQLFGKRLIEQGTPAAIYNTGSENSFFIAVSHSAAYVASKLWCGMGIDRRPRQEVA